MTDMQKQKSSSRKTPVAKIRSLGHQKFYTWDVNRKKILQETQRKDHFSREMTTKTQKGIPRGQPNFQSFIQSSSRKDNLRQSEKGQQLSSKTITLKYKAKAMQK